MSLEFLGAMFLSHFFMLAFLWVFLILPAWLFADLQITPNMVYTPIAALVFGGLAFKINEMLEKFYIRNLIVPEKVEEALAIHKFLKSKGYKL